MRAFARARGRSRGEKVARRPNLGARGVAAAALGVVLVATQGASAGGRGRQDGESKPRMEASRVSSSSSSAGGGKVTIKGWATFSGQIMGSTKDPKADAGPALKTDAEGTEIIEADFIYRPENEDFFLRIELVKIPPAGAGLGAPTPPGHPLTLYGFRFNAKNIPYEIRVHQLPTADPAEPTNIAPTDQAFGLFKCENEVTCLLVAKLRGGYGTAGEKIVTALPLEVLHKDGTKIQEGDKIGEMYVYTANPATFPGGAMDEVIQDDARLIKVAAVEVPKKSVTIIVGNQSQRAQLKDGYFEASFPARLFRKSPTTVSTRTCLGKECVKQKFKVRA
jgi:hypothetical protein